MSLASRLVDVLDESPDSSQVTGLLNLVGITSPDELSIKTFKSISYHSSQSNGISLQFEEQGGSTLSERIKGKCKAVDIYNEGGVKGWSAFSSLPISLPLMTTHEDAKAITFTLDRTSSGAELVTQLGEPSRKGGGEPMKGGGASGLGPGAWMEWSVQSGDKAILIMIEMAGQEARGQDRWEKERAGAARWGVCTISLND